MALPTGIQQDYIAACLSSDDSFPGMYSEGPHPALVTCSIEKQGGPVTIACGKEGHLYKYRNFMKGWQYRYFKLTRSYLLYYEAQHAPGPRSQLVRTEITSATSCSTFPDKQHCFQLVTKSSDTWYLMATSESELHDWIRVLTAHLPPSVADGGKLEKEKLALDDTGPPSPTLPVPPIPSYMAPFTNEAHPSAPPSYDDLFNQQT